MSEPITICKNIKQFIVLKNNNCGLKTILGSQRPTEKKKLLSFAFVIWMFELKISLRTIFTFFYSEILLLSLEL
jgi:hypothetical protein